MKARNTAATEITQAHAPGLVEGGWYHSMLLPTGEIMPGFQSVELLQRRVAQFPIPQDLRGKRVLDIGAWDGWFTFEMERRGASVVAIDASSRTHFLQAKELVGSRAEHHIMDVMDLSPDILGVFDIVLFLGVLYHLKHPLLALERVCAMSTDLVLVESYVSDAGLDDPIPRMEFYEYRELCGQFDNWVGPNTACLLAWCRTAGFASVKLESVIDQRAHVSCFRRWAEVGRTGDASPHIISVCNATSLDLCFSSRRDEYLSVWFESAEKDLGLHDVFPSVGSFGSRPVAVVQSGEDKWEVTFKLPLGLRAGWHEVSLRIRNGAGSNVARIGIDRPALGIEAAGAVYHGRPEVAAVTDGRTWETSRIHTGPGSCVAVWVRWLPKAHVTRRDVEIRLSGSTLPAVFVSEPDAEGAMQVNALLPSCLAPGRYYLQVCCRALLSAAVEVDLL